MKPWCWLLACAGLILLGGLNLVHGADRVLVPGDPPLTLKNVDRFQRLWEWYCDIRLTPQQRRGLQQAFANLWRKRYKAGNETALASHRALEKEWLVLRDMEGAEQERKRAQTRAIWISNMRKSKDDVCRFLVPIYNAAYRPGGSNNPILVAGDPPLTRGMVELENDVLELGLDFRFTVEQRHKCGQLLVVEWKGMTPVKKREWAKNNETWAELPARGNYWRNLQRAFLQPRLLAEWRKPEAWEQERWLLGLYEAAYKPGSARNPVLVDGDPPLTQQLADRYRDYLEVMLDLSLGGGFSDAQREVLQDYLVKGWKKMKPEDRKHQLTDLKRWADAAGRGPAEANKSIGALRPKLLAQLYTTPADPRSQWLLEVLAQERKKLEQLTEVQRLRQESRRSTLRSMEIVTGRWEYNSNTRRYHWLPNR